MGMVVATMACSRAEAPPQSVIAVRVRAVESGTLASATPYSGTVEAVTAVTLSFNVGGYVQYIAEAKAYDGRMRPLQGGDRIVRGGVLAGLREDEYAARLAELRGMRDQTATVNAKANLDLLRGAELLPRGAIPQAEFDALRSQREALAGASSASDARVREAEISLADTQLKSPIDGIVLARSIEVGALVAPGSPAFRVADTSRVKVLFAVPDAVARVLRAGAPVSFTTEAVAGRAFTASVTNVAAQADTNTRLFDIEATSDNRDGVLKVGMVTALTFDAAADATPFAVVPLSAVVRPPSGERGFAVYTVARLPPGSPTFAQRRTVDLGGFARNQIAVTRGLSPGELVIVQGASLATDGAQVDIVP
jgi:RND family efflux transporter MFP subunit